MRSSKPKNLKEKANKEISKVADELRNIARQAEKEYKDMDAATKKKIVAGVAGAAGLIAAAMGAVGIYKRKKK